MLKQLFYEKFKSKTKLITSGKKFDDVISVRKKIERSVSAFFEKKGEVDPTKNFEWDYIVVDNDKVVNAWCTGRKNSCIHRNS